MIRVMAEVILVPVVSGLTGLYFESHLHIDEPVIYYLLGIVSVVVHIAILYKVEPRN